VTVSESKLRIDSSAAAKLRLGILCIGMDPGPRATLEVMVAQTPGAHVVDNVERRIVPREVMRLLEAFQHRICIIDLDDGAEESCRIVERLRDSCDNSINFFAASSDSQPEMIMAAMRSGCSEFLVKPFDSEKVANAVGRVAARRHIRDEDAATGRVVTLMGAKGGTGATSLALHLALNLVGRHQKNVLLVDQHPALGDVSLYLGLPRHQYSFYELVQNTDRLDNELLQGFLLKHESGLHILDSPEVIGNYPHAAPEAIQHTLAFLSESYEFVLVDCPPGMTDDACAAIQQSDQLAIVITPELPAIRNAVRSVEFLVGQHYPEKNIDIVLNRQSRNSLLSDEDIETTLHRPIAAKIPNSYVEIANAINSGMPISLNRDAKLAWAFDDWTNRLLGSEPDTAGRKSSWPGWFNLFGSRT
jgi:pilus assembly protein CpaE